MRNAIPRECEVVITVPADEEADVLDYVKECEACFHLLRSKDVYVPPDTGKFHSLPITLQKR